MNYVLKSLRVSECAYLHCIYLEFVCEENTIPFNIGVFSLSVMIEIRT